jgi:hypothetical protein
VHSEAGFITLFLEKFQFFCCNGLLGGKSADSGRLAKKAVSFAVGKPTAEREKHE